MSEAQESNPLDFDTWIYAMEAYRANIEAHGTSAQLAEGNEIAQAYPSLFWTPNRRVVDKQVNVEYGAAKNGVEEAFSGYEELRESILGSKENGTMGLLDFCANIMDAGVVSDEGKVFRRPNKPENTGSPYPNLFKVWLTQTEEGQAWLRPAKYLDAVGEPKSPEQLRVEICEEVGQAMLKRHQELGLGHPESVMHQGGKPRYLVETDDEKHTEIDEETLARLVAKNGGPRVVMTGNHCWLEQEKPDISMATSPIHTLMKHATGDVVQQSEKGPVQVNEEFTFTSGGEEVDLDSLGQDSTLLVTLAYTRENNFLNLASLFERLIEVKKDYEGIEEDNFSKVSPASNYFVATLLKTIANNPEVVNVPEPGQGGPFKFVKEGETLSLSAAAPGRMRDMICYAFSQGGNTIYDALRVYGHALETEAVKVPQGEEKEIFIKQMNASLSATFCGLNEIPLKKNYVDMGLHAALVTGVGDAIAVESGLDAHHFNPHLIIENGTHLPPAFMQAIMEDPRTRARVMSHSAPLAGADRASVAMMDVVDDHTLSFELGPTTHEGKFRRAAEQFKDALLEAGVVNARWESAGFDAESGRRVYHIKADDLFAPEVFEKVDRVIHAQAEEENQPFFFNCMAKEGLCRLKYQVDNGKEVQSIMPKIEEIYRHKGTPQLMSSPAVNDNDTGTPASSFELADAVVSPMVEQQQQVALG